MGGKQGKEKKAEKAKTKAGVVVNPNLRPPLQPKPKWKISKRLIILGFFGLVAFFGASSLVFIFGINASLWDFPPTEHSSQACFNTIVGIFFITFVALLGIFILLSRFTTKVVGVIYMFLLVLCLIFPIKGMISAFSSLKNDRYNNIHKYVSHQYYKHRLHNFWGNAQRNARCCGTMEIDKVEDWPYYLDSDDFPASCCNNKQQKYAKSLNVLKHPMKIDLWSWYGRKPENDPETNYCGRGLGRTRTRSKEGNLIPGKRVYGGFYAILSEDERVEIAEKFKTGQVFPIGGRDTPKVKINDPVSEKIKEKSAQGAFKQIWKNYYVDSVCNLHDWFKTYTKDSRRVKPPHKYCVPDKSPRFDNLPTTPDISEVNNDIADNSFVNHLKQISSIGWVKNRNTTLEYCLLVAKVVQEIQSNTRSRNNFPDATKYCEDMLPVERVNATTLGRELVRQLDYISDYLKYAGIGGTRPMKWTMWDIPTEETDGEDYPLKLAANLERSKGEYKRMTYITRGIAENRVLRHVVHDRPCETMKESYQTILGEKLAKDINKRFRIANPWSVYANSDAGLGQFFVDHLRKVMYGVLGICAGWTLCTVLMAIMFWILFSGITAEEHANLPVPTELAVLERKQRPQQDVAAGSNVRKRRTFHMPKSEEPSTSAAS